MSWSSKYDPPILGKTYGELTVIEDYRIQNKKTKDLLEVQCSCGKITTVQIDRLIRGITKSCGHLLVDFQRKQQKELLTKPSKFETMVNIKEALYNHYTLTEYYESGRRNGIRLRNYTIQCHCGLKYSKSNDINTPIAYSKSKICLCKYSDILKDERIRNNYSVDNIAKHFNVSTKHVLIWENPEYDIEYQIIKELFQLYKTPGIYQKQHIHYREHLGSQIIYRKD